MNTRSLDTIQKKKTAINRQLGTLAEQERAEIERLNKAFADAGSGYRIVLPDAADGNGHTPPEKKRAAKDLKFVCTFPRCGRRFAHPLPRARHFTAMHKGRRKARKK